mmetsp:Transcript_41905/g.125278  ORF Transcript_41905/g.125278 Transcript_41905/m.125278 type:complete len:219 (+) Transcript_41905:83-739(+)
MGGEDGPARGRTVILVWAAAALLPAWWLNSPPELNDELEAAAPLPVPIYTLAELGRYNGELGESSLLVAVWGRVFNVTSGEEFYGVGQGYHVFAGHDCTRAFALTSTKKKQVDRDLEGLSDEKLAHLNQTYWETYVAKYPIVGRLVDPPYDPTTYDHFAGPYASIRPSSSAAGANGTAAQGGGGRTPRKRKSRCPVTRAARAVGSVIANMFPRQLLPA